MAVSNQTRQHDLLLFDWVQPWWIGSDNTKDMLPRKTKNLLIFLLLLLLLINIWNWIAVIPSRSKLHVLIYFAVLQNSVVVCLHSDVSHVAKFLQKLLSVFSQPSKTVAAFHGRVAQSVCSRTFSFQSFLFPVVYCSLLLALCGLSCHFLGHLCSC